MPTVGSEGSDVAPEADTASVTQVAGLAAEAQAAGLALVRAPRAFDMKCRKCYARVVEGESACTLCGATLPVIDRTLDRRKRVAHRSTHATAKRALVDDEALKRVLLTAPSLDADANEDERLRAMQSDLAAMSAAAVGIGTSKQHEAIDHNVDAYLNIITRGAHRFVEERDRGIVVTLIPVAILAGFYLSFGIPHEDVLKVPPGGFYTDFLGRALTLKFVAELYSSISLRATMSVAVVFDLSARILGDGLRMKHSCSGGIVDRVVAYLYGSRIANVLRRDFNKVNVPRGDRLVCVVAP